LFKRSWDSPNRKFRIVPSKQTSAQTRSLGGADQIDRLACLLRARRLAVFCGAGISVNSGLPTAYDLKRAIVAEIVRGEDADPDLFTSLGASQEPFELFLERIVRASHEAQSPVERNDKMGSLLDVLQWLFTAQEADPCTNHIFIARLLMNRNITTVLTTNFDPLVERAIAAEPSKGRKSKIAVLSGPNEFERRFNPYGRVPHIIKLHGSADRDSTLIALLESVSMRLLVEIRARLVNKVFAAGPHETVLVLGYSCSDLFDIVPTLTDLRGNLREVILIRHSPCSNNFAVQPHRYPFERYPGCEIVCNTDDLISELWRRCQDLLGPYRPASSSTPEWKTYISLWGKRLRTRVPVRSFTLGSLCSALPRYDLAHKHFAVSLQEATSAGDLRLEWQSAIRLAETLYFHGDLERATQMSKQAQDVVSRVERLGHKEMMDSGVTPIKAVHRTLCLLSRILIDTGNLKDAARRSAQALEIEERLAFDSEMGYDALALIVIAYSHLGNYSKAAEKCELLTSIANNGSPQLQMAALVCRGHLCKDSGKTPESIKAFRSALALAEVLCDSHAQATLHNDLGDALEKVGATHDAIASFEAGLVVAERIQAKLVQARCCTNLGYAHFTSGNLSESLRYHQMALLAEQSLRIRLREGTSHLNIGSVFGKLGDYTKAIECYLAAEQIFTNNGSKNPLPELYKNLALACDRIGNPMMAARYRNLQHPQR
jgi:tetratricopeptide (TPR) repeat protein